jgi:acylphosphatase
MMGPVDSPEERPEDRPENRRAADVVVTGRVQGVFFRAAMREQAQRLRVTGWARNEPDGSVHAHIEGSPDAVDELVAWCSQGSPQARVEDVRRSPGELTGARSFETW